MESTLSQVIKSKIKEVYELKEGAPVDITDGISLFGEGLGLDSLDLAMLVASLQEELEHDPFAEGAPRFQSVKEFIALYENPA